jgi:hypothetical protein
VHAAHPLSAYYHRVQSSCSCDSGPRRDICQSTTEIYTFVSFASVSKVLSLAYYVCPMAFKVCPLAPKVITLSFKVFRWPRAPVRQPPEFDFCSRIFVSLTSTTICCLTRSVPACLQHLFAGLQGRSAGL